MIAPQPFFEPRGTPFSEFHRIKALTALGHEVDLVTYPFGADVTMPGLRVFRSVRPPFVRGVRIGPSFAKLPLDALLAFTACRRAIAPLWRGAFASASRRAQAGKYDAIHSHEEGGLIGISLAALLRVPHVYDMHSSLPQQLTNFSFTRSTILRRVFDRIERLMIKSSRVVIVICPSLEATARAIDPGADVVLIENAPGSADESATTAQAAAVRAEFDLAPAVPVVLYTGTFEAYQGLELLFAAMAAVRRSRPDVRLLLAGGKPAQVERARRQVRDLGLADVTLFAGERPASDIPAFLLASDVLVSPRSKGTNTPLKIYQYMRSGKPIVATRLLTHTQVLSDDTAILTGVSAEEFAGGMLRALDNPLLAQSVGLRARELAETKYSYAAYLERTRRACSALAGAGTGSVGRVKDVKDVA